MHDAPDKLHKTIEIVYAGAYRAPQGQDFPPHCHTHWELVYYRTGHIRCPVGNAEFDVTPGTLLLTPPRVVHSEQACTDYANYYIGINVPRLTNWPQVCFDGEGQKFRRVCETIVGEWQGGAAARDMMLGLLVGQLDLLLQRAAVQENKSAAERMVAQAEALFAERFAEGVTVLEIAREVGASASALRAAFARLRGYSPQEHLQRVRMQNALALLRHSTMTLDAVAARCGYCSASHLSRHVRRETGQSPGTLRP